MRTAFLSREQRQRNRVISRQFRDIARPQNDPATRYVSRYLIQVWTHGFLWTSRKPLPGLHRREAARRLISWEIL